MDGVVEGSDIPDARCRVAGIAERDAEFSALVDGHAALMYRVAFSLLKQPQDAEDAVQETY